MRISIAGNDPSLKHDHMTADAVGQAIEKEFTERLPDAHLRELTYEEWPLAHSLTLEYKGKKHTYNLPSENSLQTAPWFCEVIVTKLIHDLTPSRISRKRLTWLRPRILGSA